MTSFLCHLKLISTLFFAKSSHDIWEFTNKKTKTQKSNLSSFLVVLWIKLIVGLDKLKFSNETLNWALNQIGFKKLRILLKLTITV